MTHPKSQPAPSGQPPKDTGPSELEQLRTQAEEYLNGWKRAKADYANLQKETERRQGEFIQYANAALLHELLPLVDHFKQAFKHLPKELKNSEWVKGIGHIQTHLGKILTDYGVQEITTVGEPFDPTRHEAVEEVASDRPAGTIVEEVKTGFLMQGKVLQAARVKISSNHKKDTKN